MGDEARCERWAAFGNGLALRLALGLVIALAAAALGAEPPTVAVSDEEGAAGRVGAPVAAEVALPEELVAAAKANRLTLAEVGAAEAKPFPAQFEPGAADAAKGTLRWLMPALRQAQGGLSLPKAAGPKGQRRFRLEATADAPKSALAVALDEATQAVNITEGGQPVLRYSFGTVPVPKGVGGIYAVARSDYVHPLYGPAGEVLTRDYPSEHPHHRGLYWAWPEVAWKGETLDLHALQGVFARPVRIVRMEGGPVAAAIVAENKWMWHDKEPIVSEVATVRAFAQRDGSRFVDLEFQFRALVDGVTVARRGQNAYGGFNLRFSTREGQKIASFNAPAGAPVPTSWGHIVGVPPEGKEPIGVAILQNEANPRHPGDWVSYPDLNWLQPTFPSKGEKFPLSKAEPLRLAYRLWVHRGDATEQVLADEWLAYSRPPREAVKPAAP